jgi:hypothetical protein
MPDGTEGRAEGWLGPGAGAFAIDTGRTASGIADDWDNRPRPASVRTTPRQSAGRLADDWEGDRIVFDAAPEPPDEPIELACETAAIDPAQVDIPGPESDTETLGPDEGAEPGDPELSPPAESTAWPPVGRPTDVGAGPVRIAAMIVGALLMAAGWLAGRANSGGTAAAHRVDTTALVLEELGRLRGQNAELATSVASMKSAIAELSARPAAPPPAPAVDLDPLRRSVEEVKTAVAAREPGASRDEVGKVAEAVADVKARVESLASSVAESRRAVMKPAAPTPAIAPEVVAALVPLLADGYARGGAAAVDQSARDLLRLDPQDARLWYLAALARGAATGDWANEPARHARRGQELEAQGHPPASEVDALLSRFDANSRGWLNYYRAVQPGR